MKVCLDCKERFSSREWKCPHCDWAPGSISGYPAFVPDLALASDGFDPAAHERLIRIEEKCFWFRGRNRLLKFFLEHHFPSAKSLMEIGCGTGYVLAGLSEARPKLRLTGGDIYVNTLKLASGRVPSAEFLQVDARQLPFEEEFDVVGAFDVLEHIEDDEVVLREMYRSTKTGGGAIITVPQHQWLWSATDETSYHKRRYTRAELLRKVENAGFRPVRVTSFITFLFPAMLVSRLRWWLKKTSETGNQGLKEAEINPFVDGVLEKICGLERYFIERGVSFPFGGSLLFVASKE